jgi:ATPase subunit of ABC transporter with duplicated ATPase domains
VILSIENGEVVVYDGDYKHFMEQNEKLRELVEGRYIEGERRIRSAPRVEVLEGTFKETKKKKNFGGKGVTSGRKDKGVKNAKRSA